MEDDASITRPAPGGGALALRRRTDQRVLGGVCAGLATRLRVDPLLVRCAAVLLALSSGFGLAAYAWAWFVVPQEGRRHGLCHEWFPQLDALSERQHVAIGCALGGLLCLVLGSSSGTGIGPGVVLVLLVVAGSHRPVRQAPPGHVPIDPARSTPALTGQATRGNAPILASLTPQPVPAPRRASWASGLAALGLAVGAAGLAGLASVQDVRLARHAAFVAALAAWLLAGWLLRAPRPRLVVAASLVALASAAAGPLAPPPVAPRHVAATSALPRGPVEVTGTTVHYDLTGALERAGDEPVRLELEAQASDVTIVLPPTARLQVDGELSAAHLLVDHAGQRRELTGFSSQQWSTPGTGPLVVLDLDLTASTVEVRDA